MVRPTPPPRVTKRHLLVIPYLYAAILVILVGLMLVGFGGFDFAGFAFETQGKPWFILSLVLVEIFALPFLLRLNLSPLARSISAVLSLLVPILFFLYVAVGTNGLFSRIPDYVVALVMFYLAGASFRVLHGENVIKLPRIN